MFAKLFASGGLSLDRLRSLLEVGAAGSIVKAASGDPVKQSQYSRQVKELEDFFGVALLERHGRGIRLTANGVELTRIARFFLLALSNFQRGCAAEDQRLRIGASPTVIQRFVMPALGHRALGKSNLRIAIESCDASRVEARLHDLSLDFAITTSDAVGRPLAVQKLHDWHLDLWCPREICRNARELRAAFRAKRLPLVLAIRELDETTLESLAEIEPAISCDDFLSALAALDRAHAAVLLPDFLRNEVPRSRPLFRVKSVDTRVHSFFLAWNPRILRLNSGATRLRDALHLGLSAVMKNLA